MTRRKRAFTLVEMLVALAITSILVVLLVNVVSAALAVWEQGRNQIDTLANARQVLGRIADEISGAIAAPSPRVVEFSENLSSIQSTSPVPATSENVFFVAPYPNVMSGDLCVIAYRHDNNSHTLERGFFDSQNAWNGGAANRYQSSSYTSTNWQWRTIANGVLEFEIQSYSQQDLDSTTSPSPTPIASWSSTGTGVMSGNTPRQVIIRIKVVDDRTLVKLAGLTPGNATYDRLVNRAARQFTASVILLPPH
jgi:prepilin-type N-terminal cleavage/methylation domain-containing protein